MPSFILALLNLVVSNTELQAMAAHPVAQGLADILPDATEDNIADFLDLVAKDLRAVHSAATSSPTPAS